MKKYISLFFIFTMLTSGLMAQEEDFAEIDAPFLDDWILDIDFGMGLPGGDLNDYIDGESSYRNFSIGLERAIGDHFAVGGRVGWLGFYKKYDRNTYDFSGGAITTSIFNYMYIVPLQATAQYFPLKDCKVQPFAGLGAGLFSTTRKSDIGIFDIDKHHWKFGLTPEIGLIVPIGSGGFGLEAKYRYNYIIYDELELENLYYSDIKIGLVVSF